MQEILENPFSTHLLITAVIILIGFVVVRLSHRVSRRFLDDPERIYRSTKSTRRTVAFLAIIAIAIVWSPGFGDLLTLITVIGAGLAYRPERSTALHRWLGPDFPDDVVSRR